MQSNQYTAQQLPLLTNIALVILAILIIGLQVVQAEDNNGGEKPVPAGHEALLSGTYESRRKGELALEDGIHSAAREYFRQYREETGKKEPDFADATILLMKTLLLEAKPAEAETTYRYYRNNSPGLENPRYREELTYWYIRTLQAADKTEQALTEIEDFLEQAKNADLRAQTLQTKAVIQLADKGNTQAAIETYELLIEKYESHIDIYPYLALIQVYLAGDNIQKAEETLTSAEARIDEQEKVDDTSRARLALHSGLIKLRQKNLETALEKYEDIEKYIPAAENKAELWVFLSELVEQCMEDERSGQALEIIPQAIPLAPSDEDKAGLTFKRALAFIEEDRLERAIDVFEQLKEQYPEAPVTIQGEFKLAELLEETGNISLAAEHFSNVAENDKADRTLRYRSAIREGENFNSAERFNNASAAFEYAADLTDDTNDKAHLLMLAADAAFKAESFSNAAMRYKNIAENFQDTEFAAPARLKQAQARAKAELFSDAASTYKKFIEEYPESDMLETALIERGVALRNAENFTDAVDLFQSFAQKHADSSKFAEAMMEGFYTAKAAGEFNKALDFLHQIQDKQPDSELLTEALYQEINLLFLLQRTETARSKARQFIEDYEKLPLTADVLLWLGDSLANHGKLAEARRTYLEAVSLHPDTPQARMGYLEAATCAVKEDSPDEALELLNLLIEEFDSDNVSDIHSRAHLIKGNIFAERGDLDKALEAFRQAEAAAQSRRLRFTAIGRIGDMHYSLATSESGNDGKNEKLTKATARYKTIVEAENSPADITENAKYRMGKCYEKSGRMELAIETYLDVFYQYQIDLMENDIRNWYYFARSGYDAAHLLLLQGNREQAARIYERLAQSGIPSAEEAARQATLIRQGQDVGRSFNILEENILNSNE